MNTSSRTRQGCPWLGLGLLLGAGLFVSVPFVAIAKPAAIVKPTAADLVAPPRNLEIKRATGSVYYTGDPNSSVRTGDKLTKVGQGFSTGSRSSAIVAIDQDAATINVSENTTFAIKEMRYTPNGGQITLLKVTKGQVRLSVRPLNNTQSRLEIETPAGVTGVRGTEFGVGVSDNGKTSVATTSGQVAVTGAGQTVFVDPGYGSIVVPGQPPTVPQVLAEVLKFDVEPVFRDELGQVMVTGQVDPLSLLWVDRQMVETDKDGAFSVSLGDFVGKVVEVRIQNPLGKNTTVYAIVDDLMQDDSLQILKNSDSL
jgi:hypothetical protein